MSKVKEIIVIDSDEDDESSSELSPITRRQILEPAIHRVVDALGGYEGSIYRLGDSVGPCLSDLKKLWRKDDTDDDRTVARIFWETRVLPKDLVPILLELANNKGLVEDKKVIAVADLCCAMTWPIDMAEELKELDEEWDKGTDYTQLMQSHLAYKQALLRPGVMQALFNIMLPPLAKSPKERTPRDGQVVNVILYIFRNLAFIRDARRDVRSSADQAELSALQGKLIRQLEEVHAMELLLAIAANEGNDPMFNGWNTLVLEIFYLLFRGVKPAGLSTDLAKQPTENLHRLLQAEEKSRRDVARKASSRHSRFGTTISVQLNPNKKPSTPTLAPDPDDLFPEDEPAPTSSTSNPKEKFILHRQAALTQSSGSILDFKKRSVGGRTKKMDELGTREEDSLGSEARGVLRRFAGEVLEGCFNPFLAALLKDIKSERPKITEKDNLRLLFVTKWFLEFFLSSRAKGADGREWGFGLVAEVVERGWIVWVLKRMREAVEDKPKQWTELQAGVECLTQLLLLIDAMSSSASESESISEAAETLRHQLIYNGEVLDIALDSVRQYKPGTQSLTYLDSSIYLAYALLKMLEKWGKKEGSGEMYVRKKKKTKKRKGGKANEGEDGGVPDVEDIEDQGEDEEVVMETMFSFEAFEMKFANSEITKTLLAYLARYKEFESSENMKRIVNLLHRQAIRAKAEGLFFNVSTLNLFKSILDDQKSFPREQPYKDLISVVNFVLRKFFKALEEEPFLAVEAFFPKNRSQWKQYSSWEPEPKVKGERGRTIEDTRFPADVQVKKGYSWSEQLGIAIAALVDAGQQELIDWTKDILTIVSGTRQSTIDKVDVKPDVDSIEDLSHTEEQADLTKKGPSTEALSQLTDWMIPYTNDEEAAAGTRNPHLKLVWRLCSFFILDEDADEFEWFVPSSILPEELRRSLNVINQFLETPLDLGGKKAKELLSKKTRRRRRARRSPSNSDSDAEEDQPKLKKKKEKKQKEKEIYKSAQFIEDSDEEYGDMDAFLEKEKELRERTSKAAKEGGKSGTMKATGTKKRRRSKKDGEAKGKKKRRGEMDDAEAVAKSDADDSDIGVIAELEADDASSPSSPASSKPRPRPRPKPRPKGSSPLAPNNAPSTSPAAKARPADVISIGSDEEPVNAAGAIKKQGRIVISDDEE